MALPEVDLREIDLSVDLRINLVLISEINTEIGSEIDRWDTIERSISEIPVSSIALSSLA